MNPADVNIHVHKAGKGKEAGLYYYFTNPLRRQVTRSFEKYQRAAEVFYLQLCTPFILLEHFPTLFGRVLLN